jgi:hypothetical protein
MADSFAINKIRINQVQENFSRDMYLNRAFALCSANKETFENCFVKYVKGWSFFKEALDEQYSKDEKKYSAYKKMEDRQTWLRDRSALPPI